jgi:hypothetical protein
MVKIIRISLYIGLASLIFGDTVTQSRHFDCFTKNAPAQPILDQKFSNFLWIILDQ